MAGALCALGLTACGDDELSDEEKITAVVSVFAAHEDVTEARCEVYSAEFQRKFFGSPTRCREVRYAGSSLPKGVQRKTTTENTKITGDTAETTVVVRTGKLTTRGLVTMRREGGVWKVDGISTQYLRSDLARRVADPRFNRTAALSDPEIRRCNLDRTDASLRAQARYTFGREQKDLKEFAPEVARCTTNSPKFQAQVRDVFDAGVERTPQSRADRGCMARKLEADYDDKRLAEIAFEGKDAIGDVFKKLVDACKS